LNLVSCHGSKFSLVDVISIELKVDVMLEYFWILTKEHRGGKDQHQCKDDNGSIDLHYWWLLSIISLEVSSDVLEDHVGQDCWVNELDAHTEVTFEGCHPSLSSLGCWTGQTGDAHGKLVDSTHEDFIEPGHCIHTGNLE